MGKKIVIKYGDKVFYSDLENASIIMGEPISKGADLNKLNVNISEGAKSHSSMTYTTDISTLKLIFENMTLRSSSLVNANLNDPVEKERVGVTEFAHSRFITCFCQSDHELVPVWMYYGKKIRKNKIMMRFNNFASNIENCIYTDYALVADNKKCFFMSDEIGNIINDTYSPNESDYDIRGFIDVFLMFDVEYVPCNDDVFTSSYVGNTNVDFVRIMNQNMPAVSIKGYDPTVLGKQKSNPWEYEQETRILCALSGSQNPGWEYIDLRLKPELFRGLTIILSPWDDGNLRKSVENIINTSKLPKDIKESITVEDSGLKGKLNFPENE